MKAGISPCPSSTSRASVNVIDLGCRFDSRIDPTDVKDVSAVSDDDLAMEVRQLRALVEQYAEEIAKLRAEARQVRVDNGLAANARLTPEEFAFAREMALAGQKPRTRLRAS